MKILPINLYTNNRKLSICKQNFKKADCNHNPKYSDVPIETYRNNFKINFGSNSSNKIRTAIFIPHFDSKKSLDGLMFFVDMNSEKTYRYAIPKETIEKNLLNRDGELDEDALYIYSKAFKSEFSREIYEHKAVSDYVYHVMQETKDDVPLDYPDQSLDYHFYNIFDDYFMPKGKSRKPSDLSSKTIFEHIVKKDKVSANLMDYIKQIEIEKDPVEKFNRAAQLALAMQNKANINKIAQFANHFASTIISLSKQSDGSLELQNLDKLLLAVREFTVHSDCLETEEKVTKAVHLINEFPNSFDNVYVKNVVQLINSFDELPDNFDVLFNYFTALYEQNPSDSEKLKEAMSGIIQYADSINRDYFDLLKLLFNPTTSRIDMKAYQKMKKIFEYSDLLSLNNPNGTLNSSDSRHFSEQKRVIEKYFKDSRDVNGELKADLPNIKEFVDNEFGKN